MKKKLLTLFLALSAMMLSTACGGKANNATNAENSINSNGNTEIAENEDALNNEIPDLTGTWKSEDNDGSYQEAIISDGVITINWVSDAGKTKSVYWIGTYTAPTEAVETYEWISERDKEKTDTALLASTDDTKTFSYKDGILSYEVSAVGTTTTLELIKE